MTPEEYWNLREVCAHNNYKGHGKETYGWWLQTHAYDFWELINKLNSIEPKIILELGTNHGGSAVFWDHLVGSEGQVITIDHPLLLRDHHPVSMFDARCCSYQPVSDLTSILSDSHLPETLEKVKNLLRGPVDFLYIDGDHGYVGAKMDYEMYSPLVRKGGIIAMDDIAIMVDVQRVWDEIQGEKVLIRDHPESRGIGIVYV